MKKPTTLTAVVPTANVEEAWQQGHSKNPSGYSFDGVVAIFPKVLASFGDRETALADHANCGVS